VFYVFGATSKCWDYVKSCLLCQKDGNLTVGGKAPIYSMPVVTEPFHTVYIDLIGEIHPTSSEGHKYVVAAVETGLSLISRFGENHTKLFSLNYKKLS